MSEWRIYSADGAYKATATEIEYTGNWMEESFVTATEIHSPVPVQFVIGDWLEYRGERFEINYEPEVAKAAANNTYGEAYKYSNIKFNSPDDELTRCDFLDFTLNDNNLHFTSLPTFSFYAASVKDLADRIQANLDRLYSGDRKWTVEVHPEYASNTNRNISVDKIKVNAALALALSEFGCNYIRMGRTITIGTAGIPADHLFKMGKGNGLKEIARQADSDQLIVTRLRVYGSERNLPRRYYNSLTGADGKKLVPDNMAVNRLMLPDFAVSTLDPYIDSPNIKTLGVREDTVMFDGSDEEHPEIFPSIEEMTAQQLLDAGVQTKAEGRLDEIAGAEQIADDGVGEEKNGEIVPDTETFRITVKDVGFDINDYWTDETPVVSFKSGMLGGREFEILQSGKNKPVRNADGSWTYTFNRVYDDSLKLFFPNKDYNAKSGDRFVLLHIDMPDVYIKAAAYRLKEKGEEYLSKHDYARSVYNPTVDDVFMADQHRLAMQTPGVTSLHDTIREGDLMVFEDADLGIDNASVFIDSIVIKEGNSPIPQYEITLKEEKTVGTLQKIQNQIDSIKGGQGNGGYNAAQIRNLISLYGINLFLSKTRADRTPYLLSSDTGFEAGRFVRGMSGAMVDGRGNAEFESIVVRSFMQIAELIVNRQRTLEGDTLLTEGDTIEEVIPMGNSDEGNPRFTLRLHPEWDGYTTAQYEGNVLRGIYNNITQSAPENDAQTTINNATYATSWMRVLAVRPTDNEIDVVMYPDDECPEGRNFAPQPMMKFARWGNAGGTEEQLKRQTVLYLSSTEGRIMKRTRVTKPIVDIGNVAFCIGTLPEALLTLDDRLNDKGDEGGYFRNLVVQNLIKLDHLGLPEPETVYRGEWLAGEDYFDGTVLAQYNRKYERSCVLYYGCQWLCAKTGTQNPPSWDSADWVLYLGDPRLVLEWAGSEDSVAEDNPDITLEVLASIYHQDVTYDPNIRWDWTRESVHSGVQDTAGDALWNSAHSNWVGGGAIHLTRPDMNYAFGRHPEKLTFTAEATLVTTGETAAFSIEL